MNGGFGLIWEGLGRYAKPPGQVWSGYCDCGKKIETADFADVADRKWVWVADPEVKFPTATPWAFPEGANL